MELHSHTTSLLHEMGDPPRDGASPDAAPRGGGWVSHRQGQHEPTLALEAAHKVGAHQRLLRDLLLALRRELQVGPAVGVVAGAEPAWDRRGGALQLGLHHGSHLLEHPGLEEAAVLVHSPEAGAWGPPVPPKQPLVLDVPVRPGGDQLVKGAALEVVGVLQRPSMQPDAAGSRATPLK